MTKSELRKKYKILRDDLSVHQVDDLSLSIANQLLKLDIWHFTFFHIFTKKRNGLPAYFGG